MKKAALHDQEERRLESLEALGILDTLPEEDFDAIVELAAQITGMPIALISLIDRERQWFKAKVGLDTSVQETPRDLAFCAHAILQEDVFVVPDAQKDERFKDNPFVTEGPRVQFYAGAPLLSPDGFPVGTVCVIDSKASQLNEEQIKALKALSRQVTRLLELKIQVNRLKISEENLTFKRTGTESITEGIVFRDADGKIVDFNPAALKVLGLTAEELTGRAPTDPAWYCIREDGSKILPEEHPSGICLRTGVAQKNIIMGVRGADNEFCWLQVNAVPLFLNGPEKPSHCVTSFSDITNLRDLESTRRNLEMQLIESARLSALGEMAGGVAHEINNPLAIILGHASMLKKKFQENDLDLEADVRSFQKIEQTVARIAKIIKGLRTYSRSAEHDPFDHVPVSSIIEDTLELCRERFKHNLVNLQVTCHTQQKVQCRSAQISQVLMNLLLNSYDAVMSTSTPRWVHLDVHEENDIIQIKVTDSGTKIKDEVAQKMMRPFFTTKEVGKGTGLGLSISLGIMQSHGGSLSYDHQASHTTFLLTMPRLQKQLHGKVA